MNAQSFFRNVAILLCAASLAACADFDDPGPVATHAYGAHPRTLTDGPRQQCVPYVRNHSSVGIWGDAWTWWDKAAGRFGRSHKPATGAVMVMVGFDGADRGHVAVVRRVLSRREIVVDHANWLNHGEVGLDNPVMDVSGDNDWSQVRVWYTPGGHYGGRVYRVAGFILPSGPEQRVASR